jgi:hypothetical protein
MTQDNIKYGLFKMHDIEVYDLVLNGTLSQFPSSFWNDNKLKEGKEKAKELLRYLIEVKLHWDEERLKKEYCKTFLIQYKLYTPCIRFYNRSPIKYLMDSYPGKYNPWEFDKMKVMLSYWQSEENRKDALHKLFKKLNWNEEDVKEKLDFNVLEQYGLATLCRYYPSIFSIANAVYPGRFKQWELKRSEARNGYWENKQHRIEAIRWLINEKLKWTHEEVIQKINQDVFYYNGLSSLLSNHYEKSPVKAVLEAFDDEFLFWEFTGHIPTRSWTKENGKKATRWLIHERLKWSKQDVISNISIKVFEDYGLKGMLYQLYEGSAAKAIYDAFPDEYKMWELPVVPKRYWNLKTGKHAIKWLIEEKLKWDKEVVNKSISVRVFKKHGLGTMLNNCFSGSPYLALKYTYPSEDWSLLAARHKTLIVDNYMNEVINQ